MDMNIRYMGMNTGLDGFDYGVSESGIKQLKNDFNVDIENYIRILNGNKYEEFKKVLAANWVGADATDFLQDVEKTRAELEKSLRRLKNKFNAALDAALKDFRAAQDRNAK